MGRVPGCRGSGAQLGVGHGHDSTVVDPHGSPRAIRPEPLPKALFGVEERPIA
jgi:hypothetical protein